MAVASLTHVVEPWSSERVLGLATDPGSAAAGSRLGVPGAWSRAGFGPAALWGLCQGSGSTPYQTVIDLSGPAYRCSCPSRKFPCKHALGLLLLWSSGQVPPAGEPADFAAQWLAKRDAQASGPASPPARVPADPRAAAKRVADRAARVAAGLEELDQWLCDQIRTGLSGQERSGPAQLEAVAARMVDAQAPGVAARLRALPPVLASGEGWHSRLLAEYALLHLLIQAHRRLDDLPTSLAAAVRSHIGYPIARADVLAGPGVRDTWAVLGRRDTVEDRLTVRRSWLLGVGTGRFALVLSYAPAAGGYTPAGGGELDGSLLPGTGVEASVHFYPSGIRALVGDRREEPEPFPRVRPTGIDQALESSTAALAADPWAPGSPVLLRAVTPVRAGQRWLLREDGPTALPLAASAGDPWRLLALSGGRPITLAGEWTAAGLLPLAVVRRQEVIAV